jgi:hypothetical protein
VVVLEEALEVREFRAGRHERVRVLRGGPRELGHVLRDAVVLRGTQHAAAGREDCTHRIRAARFPARLELRDVDVAKRPAAAVQDPVPRLRLARARKAGEKRTHGMCEKSRSSARAIARAIASSRGSANAGGSCRSCAPAQPQQCRRGRQSTSITAPRYFSARLGAADADIACLLALRDCDV